ncbi:MAG: DUF2589 domain-containing protein [Bacteroidaceae bacterium]|nr:DUF2589 domain-containing protein [Bacteroidaceae bacterium]
MENDHISNARSIVSSTQQALNGIDFGNLMGAPLSACVNAQAQAAQSTVNFVNEVGFDIDENGNKQAVYVTFSYVNQGRMVTLAVPLLTIVPIPYIAIRNVDIKFTCTVNGLETTKDTEVDTEHGNQVQNKNLNKRNFFGYRSESASMRTSVSTKRDSASTRDSQFSIEATIDVEVHAEGGTLPAGMAKVLELLGSSMDMRNPDGELSVNQNTFVLTDTETTAMLVVQYKNAEGLYTTDASEVKLLQNEADAGVPEADITRDKNAGVITYKLKAAGDYVVKAGGQTEKITVTDTKVN